jgi:transcriptional regulator with XRE-family HTH domain
LKHDLIQANEFLHLEGITLLWSNGMSLGVISLTGDQLRAARAFARLGQAEIAKMAGVSLETIKRLERFHGPVEANSRTLTAIAGAFEAAGITFQTDGQALSIRKKTAELPFRPSSLYPAASNQDLFRLIYYSTVAPEFAAAFRETVSAIQREAESRNRSLGIAASLLASEGRFLQIIEGPKEAVWQVYGAIASDSRHHELHTLQTRPVDFRLLQETGLSVGVFNRGDSIFADEPAMIEGFAPERLSPASAVALLNAVDRKVRPQAVA